MKSQFSLTDILSMMALFVAILYNIQVIVLKRKTKAASFFTFQFLNLTFIIFFFMMLKMNLDDYVKYLTPLLIFSQLILPINLWVYLKKLTQFKRRTYWKHYIAPFIACLIAVILFVWAVLSKTEGSVNLSGTIMRGYVIFLMTAGFLALNVVYLSLSFVLLYKHQKVVRNYYSYTQRVDLAWVRYMIFGYLFLLVGLILCEIFKGFWSDAIFYGSLTLYIIFIGTNALKQQNVWSQLSEKNSETNSDELGEEIENSNQEVYTEAQLELFQDLKKRLMHVMEENKPYLDQDLTILKLAKDLQTNTKYLSFVINSEFNQNFINFINEYRVEEVKLGLVLENQNLTIEALAQEAGFKSKSSFNAAFKKSTGMTPSAYMKMKQK